MAPVDPAEAHRAELAELFDGCATRSLALGGERVRLTERLEQLSAETAALEAAVARAQVAAARHRAIASELKHGPREGEQHGGDRRPPPQDTSSVIPRSSTSATERAGGQA